MNLLSKLRRLIKKAKVTDIEVCSERKSSNYSQTTIDNLNYDQSLEVRSHGTMPHGGFPYHVSAENTPKIEQCECKDCHTKWK